MYEWIWHKLPGGAALRTSSLAVILVAVAVLLWVLVFPWATVHLAIDQVGVG